MGLGAPSFFFYWGPEVRARRMGWLRSLCVRTRRPRLYRDLEDLGDGGILYTHTQPLILFPDGDPLGTPSDLVSLRGALGPSGGTLARGPFFKKF